MRDYLKAYYLKDLRRYPAWNEDSYKPPPPEREEDKERVELNDDSIVYLGDDFVVLRDVFDDSPVIFDAVTDEWKSFCSKELDFQPGTK